MVFHCVLNLGEVLARQGKWTEPEAEYRAAIRLDPDYKRAWRGS
jgi:hypothetical protein